MIKAIETRYKGYRFRSRLEARWAVFFDRLELDWEYESEGFDLGEFGYYLPDFKVFTPQGKEIWYEVKPRGEAYSEKFAAFSRALDRQNELTARANLLCGDPLTVFSIPEVVICLRCGYIHNPAYGYDVDPTEINIGCGPCDNETPCGGYHPYQPGVLGLPVTPHKGMIISANPFNYANYLNSRKKLLADALHWLHDHAVYARSARFEHGETP
jgi:hypothetical protein